MRKLLFVLATAVVLTAQSTPVEASSIIFKNDCFEIAGPTVCNDPGGLVTVHNDPGVAEFFTLAGGAIDQVFSDNLGAGFAVLGLSFVPGVLPGTDCGVNGISGCLNIVSGSRLGATTPLVDGSGQPFLRTVYDTGVFSIQGIAGVPGGPIAGTLISGFLGPFVFDLYPNLRVGQIAAFDLAASLQPDLAAALGVNTGALIDFDLNFFLEGGVVAKNLIIADAAPIPEPATVFLVGTCLAIAGFRRVRRLSL